MVCLTTVDAKLSSKKPKMSKGRRIFTTVFGLIWLAGIVIGIPAAIGFTCHRDHEVREAQDAFLFSLHHGDLPAAYDQLTAERRRYTTLEEFEAYAAHPVVQNLQEATFDFPDDDHPGICMNGYVPMPEGKWYVQLFFLKEEGQWRLHSMGLQRPARVMLATLLPECSFRGTTMMGYEGPRPEHQMRQTRSSWNRP